MLTEQQLSQLQKQAKITQDPRQLRQTVQLKLKNQLLQ